MHKVIERTRIVPNMHLLRLEAPEVIRRIVPGNFVIIKVDEIGERIPLSPAEWDTEKGVLSIVFMTVGASTHRLAKLNAGDEIETCVGPLGRDMDIDRYGTVVVAMGCYGIGAVLPIARAIKQAGNRVIVIMEARTKDLLYWEDKYKAFADDFMTTCYGSHEGGHERVADVLDRILSKGETIDRVIAMGCTFMMKRTSEATKPHGIKTIVSLNPVMIDGTGMCGVCRCTVGGKNQFACVDGPDFDGHEVDWEELVSRRRSYISEEVRALSEWECTNY